MFAKFRPDPSSLSNEAELVALFRVEISAAALTLPTASEVAEESELEFHEGMQFRWRKRNGCA
jgi:hypothetical protein